VRVYAGLFDDGECDALQLPEGRHAYVHVARGQASVNGTALLEGDGARLRGESRIAIDAAADAEVLVFDLRPNELPQL
jgi:quercetin 2,3-dioxygenase